MKFNDVGMIESDIPASNSCDALPDRASLYQEEVIKL